MIFFCIALQAEAAAIIEHYSLQLIEDRGFKIYGRSPYHKNLFAIVSSIGFASMTAATAFIAAKFGLSALFINVGLAGHRSSDVGSVFLAHKVEHKKSHFYPSLHFPWKEETKGICTVEHIERTFSSDLLYDQEAYAFCATASKFTSKERIHVVKVVSDNQKYAFEKKDKKLAFSLIQKAIPTIDNLLYALKPFLSPSIEKEWSALINNVDIALPHRRKLEEIYYQYLSLGKNPILPTEKWQTSKQLLKLLEKGLHV